MSKKGAGNERESKSFCAVDATQQSRLPDRWEELLTHVTVREALASVHRMVGLEDQTRLTDAPRRSTGIRPVAEAVARRPVAAGIALVSVLLFGFGTGLALQGISSGRIMKSLTALFHSAALPERATPIQEVAPTPSVFVTQAEADKAGFAFWKAIQDGRTSPSAPTAKQESRPDSEAPVAGTRTAAASQPETTKSLNRGDLRRPGMGQLVMPAAGTSTGRAVFQQFEEHAIERISPRFPSAAKASQKATAAATLRGPTIEPSTGSRNDAAAFTGGGPEVTVAAVPQHPIAESTDSAGQQASPSASAAKIINLQYVGVTTTGSNFRAGPALDSTRLGTLVEGTPVVVLGKVHGANWLQIQRPQGEGVAYIYAPLLRAGGHSLTRPGAQAEADAAPEVVRQARFSITERERQPREVAGAQRSGSRQDEP